MSWVTSESEQSVSASHHLLLVTSTTCCTDSANSTAAKSLNPRASSMPLPLSTLIWKRVPMSSCNVTGYAAQPDQLPNLWILINPPHHFPVHPLLPPRLESTQLQLHHLKQPYLSKPTLLRKGQPAAADVFACALLLITTSECTTIAQPSLTPTSHVGRGLCSSPCGRAIYRLSLERQKPTRALANQSAHVAPAPVRTPHSSCANQDAWAVVTSKWPNANSETLRRVTLAQARFTQHHVQGCIFPILYFVPIIVSLVNVSFSLWDQRRVTLMPRFA